MVRQDAKEASVLHLESFELEKFPCNNKHELRAREGYYIDKYKQEVGALCVNKNREGVNSGNKK